MYARDMCNHEILAVILEILDWGEPMVDYEKRIHIQSFLLNCISAEQVHKITESLKRR